MFLKGDRLNTQSVPFVYRRPDPELRGDRIARKNGRHFARGMVTNNTASNYMSDSVDLLKAAWLNLVFLNYEVEKSLLERYLPSGVELDTYNGRHYLSIVGLMHLHTEIAGVTNPVNPEFEQVNLRFYVKRPIETGGYKHGVVFIRQIVADVLPSVGARALYNERSVQMPVRHSFSMPSDGADAMGSFEYAWATGDDESQVWHTVRAATAGALHNIQMGSKEEFLMQRPWGFSGTPGMTTLEYHVEHPLWRIWSANKASLECDVKEVFGRELVPYLSRPPVLSFVAEGSPVTVHLPKAIEGADGADARRRDDVRS